MSGREAVLLVARREIVERARDKSFLISTGITLAILVLFLVLPNALGFGDPDTYRLGVVGPEAEAVAAAVPRDPSGEGPTVETTPFADQAAAERAVADEDIDAALLGPERVVVAEELPGDLEALLSRAAAQAAVTARLEDAGVPAGEVPRLLTPPPLEVTALDGDAGGDGSGAGLAFFTIFLLYGQLFGYGFAVASGVVEEKATRVVEVLLSTIRPVHLLAGKVLGIGLLGLAQLLAFAGLGLLLVQVTGVLELPPGAYGAIALSLAWFVLGYALYACAFAVAGALVSRQEELQNAVGPLTLVVFAALFAAFAAVNDPGGLVARVASFLPPTAPMVLPVRMILGGVAAWEIVVSVLVTLAGIGLLVPFAARVYRGAVLRTGAKVRLREAYRAP